MPLSRQDLRPDCSLMRKLLFPRPKLVVFVRKRQMPLGVRVASGFVFSFRRRLNLEVTGDFEVAAHFGAHA